MSLHPNWVSLSTVDIPWKTFVKESNETPRRSERTFSTHLNFKGIEAKKAYEDVVRQNFVSDIKPKTVESTVRLRSSNSKNTRQDSTIVSKVSTNSILKAVEQNDFCFLKKHLSSDNVDVADDFGWTPLMSAAYNGNVEVVEYLLKLGVNKRAKEKSGLTAAQLALKRHHLSIVALLKRKNPRKDNEDLPNDEVTLSINANDDVWREDEGAKTSSTENHSMDKKTEFFCKICETIFKETSVKKHESSTLHIFNSKPKLRLVAYGIAKQNKGYQMLLNTGWDEETGLGPMGDGAKYPVKTILKRDRKGFGQADDKEARVTHFKPGDVSAVAPARIVRQKTLKKKDREKLLTREAMKDRMIRIALS